MARRPRGVQQKPAQPVPRDPLVEDMFDPDPRPLGEILADWARSWPTGRDLGRLGEILAEVEKKLLRRMQDRARREEREAAQAAAPRPWDERQGELDLDQQAPAPDRVDELLAAFREFRTREEERQRRREALRAAAAARRARRRA